MNKSIAIILARGGSKRLPRKNILEIGGKAMITWTIEAAKKSNCFDRVLVSTDDNEIASIAMQSGAEVPFLRDSGADDYTSSSEATLIALGQAEAYWSESYSTTVQLMSNCPLRTELEIIQSINSFKDKNVTAQISSFRYGWMNPWWACKLKQNGQPEWLFPEERNKRSQDLPELFCPSGAIWIAKTKNLKEEKTFYTKDHIFYALNWITALDIDDNNDFEMAKLFMSFREKT